MNLTREAKFDDFFDEAVEYPRQEISDGEILPLGTVYGHVSSTFVNGLINYAGSVVSAYVLSRYHDWLEILDEPVNISVQEPTHSFQWQAMTLNTKDEIYGMLSQEGRVFNSKLSDFQDDILVLCRTTSGTYWFFWFDCDVSDCCVGRFQTGEPEARVIDLFGQYATERNVEEGNPNELPRQIPIHYFQGWISF